MISVMALGAGVLRTHASSLLLAVATATTRRRSYQEHTQDPGTRDGVTGGAGIDLLIQPNSDKVAIGIPLATSLAGLAVGVLTTEEDRVQAGEGVGVGAGVPDSMALLQLDRERHGWSVRMGTPLPLPVLLPQDLPRGPAVRPAVRVELLHARF